MTPLLQAEGLSVRFPVSRGLFGTRHYQAAVNDVDFAVAPGETLAVVGESGCGKSTTIRAALGLQAATAGRIAWRGADMAGMDRRAWRLFRRETQMIFQDPQASLDPRMSIEASIAAPLAVHEPGADHGPRVAAVMARVGLSQALGRRYPHELSGGQCQRAAIARALILAPTLLVCDEPLASLDVSIQAQIVNLLRRLGAEDGLAMIFVSHNLPVVRHIADRVMVMHLGEVVETGRVDAVFATPRHPYTRALLAAVPHPHPDSPRPRGLGGVMPSPQDMPRGCSFAGRCPEVMEQCRDIAPTLDRQRGQHQAACLRLTD